MTPEEKKLVGAWGTGSSSSGYKQLLGSTMSGDLLYTWKDGSFNSRVIVFHKDGRYETVSLYVGSIFTGGGALISGTGTWSVPKTGTVLIKNQVNKVFYMDKTSKTEKFNDATVEYSFGPDFNDEGYGLMWKEYYVNGQFFDKL